MAAHLLVRRQMAPGLTFNQLIIFVLCGLQLPHEAIHCSVMDPLSTLGSLLQSSNGGLQC